MTTLTNSRHSANRKQDIKSCRMISYILKEFNHDFDNTVADTYAFYKVINSDIVINRISLYQDNLDHYLPVINKLVISEVSKIYRKYNRKVVNPDVYYLYLESIIEKIKSR